MDLSPHVLAQAGQIGARLNASMNGDDGRADRIREAVVDSVLMPEYSKSTGEPMYLPAEESTAIAKTALALAKDPKYIKLEKADKAAGEGISPAREEYVRQHSERNGIPEQNVRRVELALDKSYREPADRNAAPPQVQRSGMSL